MISNKLKLLISETYNNRLKSLNESIINDILALILSPKLKKAMKSLKSDPEFKELEQQVKNSKKEIETIANRLEKNLEARQTLIKDMNKSGIKVDINMDSDQIYQAWKTWQTKESKKIKQPEWAKYFNK